VLQQGVLVLHGHALHVSVERGHLQVEDESFGERRRSRFSRIDTDLKRIVLLGPSGSITLGSVRWLHEVGVPLVHLNSDGTVFCVAAPMAAMNPGLRRAQALAAETGLGARIAEGLIRRKVEGQAGVLSRLPGPGGAAEVLRGIPGRLAQATSLQDLRILEAVAAKAYWRAWQGVPVRFEKRDLARRPKHWAAFGSRVSPLTGSSSPRRAVNPANAILNYLYAILEAEARIAALAVGLDPALGLLHADARARDSLACDLMEPVRPAVDAFVLDYLDRRTFTKTDCFELGDGHCRLLPPVTSELAQTASRWARLVLPVAQDVAHQLVSGLNPTASPKPARRSQRVVGREFGAKSAPIERGDPRRSVQAGAKRRRAMAEVVRANEAWTGAAPNSVEYRQNVLPALKGVKLTALMTATGLSKGACSRIRGGGVVPHPRHWEALRSLS
jgi:CRISPR-associated endonuclease Cas1